MVAVPILSEDGTRLGTVLLSYAESLFLPRFCATVERVLLSTAVVLAILVPLGWYRGRPHGRSPARASPRAMRRVGSEPPSKSSRELYLGGDEIGQLGRAFAHARELEDKQALEKQMISPTGWRRSAG